LSLCEVIAGRAELADAMVDPGIENLTLLPSKNITDSPAELLTSDGFDQLLRVLREKFDYVVVDTPPLLVVSDPATIAPKVDGVVLALRLDKKARARCTEAKRTLERVGGRVLGIVVNGVGRGEYASSEYARYAYTYGSGRYDSYYLEDAAQSRATAPPLSNGKASV
jgi:capsular exopolysaccharide synthesis family protein